MPQQPGTILLAGASRGLGLGLADRYLGLGWHVVATARAPDRSPGLDVLRGRHADTLTIEQLDVADPDSVAALAGRIAGTRLDVLFVVAGINGYADQPVQDVPKLAAAGEFLTNAVAPIALAEALSANLPDGAMVAFMTSILGSIGSNAGGGMELYRASKAALNMLARCYALRHRTAPVLLMHPGWVRTEMGGERAPVDVETSVAGMEAVIAQHAGKAGIAYVDYQGTRLPW